MVVIEELTRRYAGAGLAQPVDALVAGLLALGTCRPGPTLHVWTCDLELQLSAVLYPADEACSRSLHWLGEDEVALVEALQRRCRRLQSPVDVKLCGATSDLTLVVLPSFAACGDLSGVICISVEVAQEIPTSGEACGAPGTWQAESMLDAATRSLRGRRRQVRLTPMEWALLVALLRARGAVLSRKELLAEVWGPGYENSPRLLHDVVSRLRGRLRVAGCAQFLIQTIHGVGYCLVNENAAGHIANR